VILRASTGYPIRLAAILAVGLLVRLAALAAIPTRPVSDFYGYFVVAKNLVARGRFATGDGVLDARRSPAYPALLSVALRAAPESRALAAAKAANLALFLAAGLAGAALARRLGGDRAGLWTAAVLSLLPRSILMSDLLAAENLLAPLLLAYLLLCARSWTGPPSAGRAAALGLLAGLLCLTRAVLYFAPAVWLAGALAGRLGWRRVVRELAVMLVVAHAVLLPWALRNARTFGRFTPFNLSGGVGLFLANNPGATGQWYAWAEDLERLHPGVIARGDAAVDDAAREEAWRWIRAHPGDAIRAYAGRLAIVLEDDAFAAEFAIYARGIPFHHTTLAVLDAPGPFEGHRRLVQAVLRASGVLLALLGAGGWIVLVRRARGGSQGDRALATGLLAAALLVPLVSAGMAVNGRYRWAAEDVLAPLAGLCLARPWRDEA